MRDTDVTTAAVLDYGLSQRALIAVSDHTVPSCSSSATRLASSVPAA
ncbi:hypothetical protein OHA04_43925 (plasmid) [Streptomyces sp. NBC_01590]